MKTFKQYLNEIFDPNDINIANKTFRKSSAIGLKAVVPKIIKQLLGNDKSKSILDFGSGTVPIHAINLKNEGYNITAYDFGSNLTKYHDANALSKKYDIVYASNVLNVQNSDEMLKETIRQISSVVKPDGFAIVNLPLSPRKGAYDNLNPKQQVEKLNSILLQYFTSIKQISDNSSSPVYKLEL